MAQSSEVTAGQHMLASQYNDLRDDVLDATLGHTHTGEPDGGAIIYARAYVSDLAPDSPFAGMIWLDTSS